MTTDLAWCCECNAQRPYHECETDCRHCDECGNILHEPGALDAFVAREGERDRVAAAFAAAGFSLINTGGGCTGFSREEDGIQTLVTGEEDACVPVRFAEAVAVGRYHCDDEGCVDYGDAALIEMTGYESVTSYLARWL